MATRSDRCSAIRFGASSPKISVKNEIARVTRKTESADRAGQQRGQGDADLDRGQEPVRVVSQFRRPLTALAPPGQRAQLAFAQRDQGHLGSREEAADEDDDQDDDDIPADATHVRIPDLAIGPTAAATGRRFHRPWADTAIAVSGQSKQSGVIMRFLREHNGCIRR
jgi:hypothetical protein